MLKLKSLYYINYHLLPSKIFVLCISECNYFIHILRYLVLVAQSRIVLQCIL
jgi:hypothetical protein